MRIDPDAVTLEELLAHGTWVRALARHLVADPALADDVEQETWLSAIRKPPREAGNLRAWFARVVRRRLRDQLRSEGRRSRHHEQVPARASVPATAELVERAETQTAVAQAVLALDEPYRSTVLLRFIEGLPPRRIAAHQGVPVATVHTRLQRALPRLRAVLADRYGPEGRSWRAALLSIAGLPGTQEAAAWGTGSTILMTTKAKVVSVTLVAVVLLLAAIGGWIWRQRHEDPRDRSPRPASAATDVVEDGSEAESERDAHLQGRAADVPAPVPPDPDPKPDLGLFAVSGTVLEGGRPTRANVEVRAAESGRAWTTMLRIPEVASPALARAEADAAGRFTIRGLAPGMYEVAAYGVSGGCGAQRIVVGPPFGGDTKTTIHLLGGDADVAGRASWADGTPFRGWVRVWSGRWFTGGGWSRAVETDAEGRFRLQGLPTGESGVAFLQPDRLLSIFWRIELPAAADEVLEFVLDEGLVPYEGRVVADDTEEPLSGVEIHIRGGGQQGTRGSKPETREVLEIGRSDENGAFVFEAGGPKAKFWFYRDGFAPSQVTLASGSEHVVRLQRRGRVRGRVVAKDGQRPVSGVPIHTWNWGQHGWDDKQIVSDDQGRFEKLVGPGRGMVFGFGGGWVSAFVPQMTSFGVMPGQVDAGQGEVAEVTLAVIETARVEGVVRDRDGRPAAGAVVRLAHTPGWRGYDQSFHHSETTITTTAEDGRFVFADLVPGFPYEVRAQRPGATQGRSEALTAVSGETHRVEIVLPAPRWLTVRVVSKGTGSPVTRAIVAGYQEGQYSPPDTETDAQGLARFGPLGPGPVWIRVERDGYLNAPPSAGRFGGAQGIAVPDPAPDVQVVELDKAFWVGGTVRFADGSPIANAGVQFERSGETHDSGFGIRGRARVGDDGAFRHGPIAAGTYDLVLVVGKEIRGRWPVEAGHDRYVFTVEAQPKSEPAQILTVRLLGPDGRAARAGVIVVHREEGTLTSWKPEVRGLDVGEVVRIEVRSPQDADGNPLGGILSEPVVVGGAAVELVLPAEARIEGRIVGPDGEGVDGLRLSAMPLHPGLDHDRAVGMLPATRTDGGGGFRFGGLPGVPHRLLLELPDTYAASPPPRVAAGATGVEIRLEAGTTADLHVSLPDGKPAVGARIRASLPAHPGLVRTTTTDARGNATLSGLDARVDYRLAIDPPPGRSDLAAVREQAWRPKSDANYEFANVEKAEPYER